MISVGAARGRLDPHTMFFRCEVSPFPWSSPKSAPSEASFDQGHLKSQKGGLWWPLQSAPPTLQRPGHPHSDPPPLTTSISLVLVQIGASRGQRVKHVRVLAQLHFQRRAVAGCTLLQARSAPYLCQVSCGSRARICQGGRPTGATPFHTRSSSQLI